MKSTRDPVVRSRPSMTAQTAIPAPSLPPARTRRKRRLWRWLAVSLGLLAVLALAAPQIIAKTGLFHWLLSRTTTFVGLEGSLRASSASLSWFSPAQINGLELSDAEGNPAAAIDKLTTERTLWSLVWNRSDLGTLHVDGVKIDVRMRRDGTNWQEILAPLLEAAHEPSGAVALNVQAKDGVVEIHDEPHKKSWTFGDVALAFRLPNEPTQGASIELTANLASKAGPQPLAVTIELPGTSAVAGEAMSRGKAHLNFAGIPLEMVQALVDRAAPGMRCRGKLHAVFDGEWSQVGTAPRSLDLLGSVSVDDFTCNAPALGSDRLQMKKIELPFNVRWEKGELDVAKLDLASDAGSVTCKGTASAPAENWSDLTPDAERVADWIASAAASIDGEIDLPRLAALLPETLRLQESAQVVKGVVSFSANCGLESIDQTAKPARQIAKRNVVSEQRVWLGQLSSSPIVVLVGGKKFNWEAPLFASFKIVDRSAGRFVENVTLQSDFLDVNAAGTLDEFEVSIQNDLDLLSSRLGQFLDLGGLRLGGACEATFTYKRTRKADFELVGSLDARDFELSIPGRTPWTEKRLTIEAAAEGGRGAPWRQITTASLNLKSGSDSLALTISPPEMTDTSPVAWNAQVELGGSLERWRARLGPFCGDFPAWNVAGNAELNTEIAYSPDLVEFKSVALEAANLSVAGPGIWVDERKVRLAGAGTWRIEDKQLAIPGATIRAASFQAALKDIALQFYGPLQPVGSCELNGDVGQLASWFTAPGGEPRVAWEGAYRASATVASERDIAKILVNAEIDKFAVASASGGAWNEPKVVVTGRAEYDASADAFALKSLILKSKAIKLDAKGEVSDLSGERNANVSGSYEYDLARLEPALQAWLGESLQVAGKQKQEFSLAGSLAGDDSLMGRARGNVAVGWDQATLFGFAFGPVDINASLAEGLLSIEPLDLKVNQGRLRIAPEVRLAGGPAEFALPSGPVIDEVDITPATCQQALMYINPALAYAAQVEGVCSLSLENCRLPLAAPATGEMAGKLTIHRVVLDSPSPLVAALAQAANLRLPLAIERESTTPFRLADGRIYHEDVELAFANGTVRTRGSVGLDQSLDILAEIPIEAIVPADKLRSSLKKKILSIPIEGTLKEPRIDRRALAEKLAEFGGSAIEEEIGNQLNRQLDRLFKK